ncbi:unnamed protein product [Vicia faba]|uniref:GOLD domain-containing protein n=1 Tax=Vicia faba TaxID=3906 RepID=A0AAV0YLK0_VICFA|nr:unnamed protein product [Vicia faba]
MMSVTGWFPAYVKFSPELDRLAAKPFYNQRNTNCSPQLSFQRNSLKRCYCKKKEQDTQFLSDSPWDSGDDNSLFFTHKLRPYHLLPSKFLSLMKLWFYSNYLTLRYIAPQQVPVQYGGLSREGEQEFTTADPATEVIIKPATKHAVEFPISEKSTLVWEIRVVDWNVSYGAEFVPSAEDGYTVVVQKNRKISPADETVINNTFKIGEPGKVVLTIDNQTSKKKKLLYRSKTIPISE